MRGRKATERGRAIKYDRFSGQQRRVEKRRGMGFGCGGGREERVTPK